MDTPTLDKETLEPQNEEALPPNPIPRTIHTHPMLTYLHRGRSVRCN